MTGKLKSLPPNSGLINPERKSLTKEKLAELSGLELTEQEAEEVLHSIHLLAKILYELTNQNNSTCIDNQYVVDLNEQNFITQKQAA
jgi:hypothetical protein